MLFCACLLFPSLLSSFLFYVSTLFLAVWCPAWLMTEAQQTNPRDGWLWGAQPPSDKATKRCMFTFITNNLASNTNNRITTPAFCDRTGTSHQQRSCLLMMRKSSVGIRIAGHDYFDHCPNWLTCFQKMIDKYTSVHKDWALDHIVAWGCVKKDRARKYRELE